MQLAPYVPLGTWAILFAERGPFESQVIDLVRFLVYLGLVLPKRVTYLGEGVVSCQALHQLLVGHCFLDLLVLCLALCIVKLLLDTQLLLSIGKQPL